MVEVKKEEDFSVDSAIEVRVSTSCSSLSDGNSDTLVLRRSSVLRYVVLNTVPFNYIGTIPFSIKLIVEVVVPNAK